MTSFPVLSYPLLPLSKAVRGVVAIFMLAVLLGLASGCATGGTVYEPTTAAVAAHYTLSGTVQMPGIGKGGAGGGVALASPPISGATVLLYAAGTGGYGSKAQLLAMTTSSLTGGGSFSFTQNANHVNSLSNVSNTYSCPSYTFSSPDGTTQIVKDSLLYLVASGGDTQDGVGNAHANSNSVLMAAIGDCQTLASTAFIDINAVSTVASMFALAPYFNPNYSSMTVNGVSTVEPGDMLGGSTSYMTDYGAQVQGGYTAGGSKKSSATTPLGYTSLVNAFATVSELETLASGSVVQSFTRSGTVAGGSNSGSIVMTGVPEYVKLNTIADILTACVYSSQTAGAASTNCQTLFAGAAPPINAYTTSLAVNTKFVAATDTLQSAYFMAVNPTDNTVNGAATSGTATNLGKLYALANAQGDYQPTLMTQPSDWTLSISYTSSSMCGTDSSAGPAIGTTPEFMVSDLQGNVVLLNDAAANTTTNAANDTLLGLSNNGTPQFCQFGSSIVPYVGPNIDLGGNVWVDSGGGTMAYQSTRSGAPIAWPATVSGSLHVPFYVTTDSVGNVNFLATDTNDIYQFTGGSFTTTPAAATDIYRDPSGTVYPNTLTAASGGSLLSFVYDPQITLDGIQISPTSGMGSTYSATSSTVSLASVAGVDGLGRFVIANSCCTGSGTAAPNNTLVQAVTSNGTTTFTSSAVRVGGMNTAFGLAIDGASNSWMTSNRSNGKVNGVATFAVVEVDQNLNGLSPNGSTGGYLKSTFAGGEGLVVDISGNVWVPSQLPGGNLTEIVGAAVPVVQPLSVAARDNMTGQKP